MIGWLSGVVRDCSQNPVVVAVGGVGYEVHVAKRMLSSLSTGQHVELYAATVYRESAVEIFGFENAQQKRLFHMLCKVHGIGSRTAVAVLGEMRVDELLNALIQQDVKTLTKVPGIGKKTAERLLVELRDIAMDVSLEMLSPATGQIPASSPNADAVAALVALGFSQTQAASEVARALAAEPTAATDRVIRRVLQGGL